MPKNEAEWLACSNPALMLEAMRGRASDRKLRLFAVGCCRFTLTSSTPDQSRHAVEVIERFADGLASSGELHRARSQAFHAAMQFVFKRQRELRDRGVEWLLRRMSPEEMDLYFIAEAAQTFTPFRIGLLRHWPNPPLGFMQTAPSLLRDVFRNPFRPVALDPTWLVPCVVKLARTIYDERATDRMAELADALEEVGCHHADILGHCRHQGPHVRGCWVVDAILGKS
jgi:hypothetical protein